MAVGALLLAALALLPSTASAQQYGVTTSTSVAGDEETTTTTEPDETTTTEPDETTTTETTIDALPDEVTPDEPAVEGDVVSRPLPRTGSELDGTALAGGALTIAGVALALAARKRRSSYEGS